MHGFACALEHGLGVRLTRSTIRLRHRERTRILGRRHVQPQAHQRQLGVRHLGRSVQKCIRETLVCERAVAVAHAAADVARVRCVTGGSTEQANVALESGSPGEGSGLYGERHRRRLDGAQVDHPARRVAIERRGGSADHLDTAYRLEVEVVDGRLAVGQRERHAVAQNADAARAECRAGAKPANGDAGILCGIGAVGDGDARQQRQRLLDERMRLSR
jgi:hypothetical protein